MASLKQTYSRNSIHNQAKIIRASIRYTSALLIEAAAASQWTLQILATIGFLRIWPFVDSIAIVKVFRL